MQKRIGRKGDWLKRMILHACACLPLFIGSELRAYPEVRFQHLSLEHGLAQSAVQDMVGDHLGYMWFGTQYGLSRYDGYGFRNFRHEPDNPASLSSSRIQHLHRCHDGAIWVGTRHGLNRLDPETLSIRRVRVDGSEAVPNVKSIVEDRDGNLVVQTQERLLFFDHDTARLRPLSFDRAVPEGVIGSLIADDHGRVWVFNVHGLWRLDARGPVMRHVLDHPVDDSIARHDSITHLPSGLLALAGREGVALVDTDSVEMVERIRPTSYGVADDWVGAVAADARGSLWLLTRQRLVRYNPGTDDWRTRLVRWKAGRGHEELIHRLQVITDRRGFDWLGLPEGVGLSSPQEEEFRLLRHDPNRPDSLTASPGSAQYMVGVDAFGIVWIGGGLGGLSRFAPQSTRFEHIIDESNDGYFATDNVVRSVLETAGEDGPLLWTGLGSSGLRIWRRSNGAYSEVVAELNVLAGDDRRLPSNEVWELAQHPQTGDVWAGTSSGLVAISHDDFAIRSHSPVVVEGSSRRVRAMEFSADGSRLWITVGRHVLVYELTDEGRTLSQVGVAAISPGGEDSGHVAVDILPLGSGELLLATRRGLVVWNPATGKLDFNYPAGEPGEHPRNFIFGLARTEDGRIWLGSEQAGLAQGAYRDGRFTDWRWHDRDDGLPDNTIYAILVSDSGRLWLSSNRGLIRFNPDTGVSRHFTLGDGLQELEFNRTVAAAGASGLYYFGGINGVNAFRPERIELHPEPPSVYLQRADINGEALALDARDPIRMNVGHDRNSLELEFVGLHFVEPQRNEYAYQLVGVDPDWVESGDVRSVRYPDLPPGDYRFRVKAANSDGVWSQPRELMAVSIASPPWLTPWAYAVYIAAGVLILAAYILGERRRRRQLEHTVAARTRELREQKQLVDQQAGELAEVLDMRTMMFANVSHEFRTPLTLIEASVDRLARHPGDAGAIDSARRYLRRLLRLADQLLNLSRLQSSRDEPVPDPWSLDRVVTMTIEAFRSLAEQKSIALDVSVDGRWMTQCHQADVERILLNLVGNALKYCPPGSSVAISVSQGDEGVLIAVTDDGPGISAQQQELIFERFNRLPAHEHGRIEGAGIGLTLVREAAQSNGGRVEVLSEPGKGSSFRVHLPAWRGHMEGAPVDRLAEQRLQLELESLVPQARASGADEASPAGVPRSSRFGTALVAEDNTDLRRHIARSLAADWYVLEAADGLEALRAARERQPDIIVSDIMMPRMDGLELLKRLRQDVRTSHLPIMLLTAKQDETTRLQGYSLSADDFLPKPFSPTELRLRLRRMVDIRSRIQARIWRGMEALGRTPDSGAGEQSPDIPDLSERDEQFLERVRHWLDANHDDPEASVADLARFLSMESRTLQRKLKSLTGRTPAAHLQAYRVEQARRMLTEGCRPIQDVAFSCGFSSPQYFSRVFTRQVGQSPSKWREERGRSI